MTKKYDSIIDVPVGKAEQFTNVLIQPFKHVSEISMKSELAKNQPLDCLGSLNYDETGFFDRKGQSHYVRLFCGFDIETTQVKHEDGKTFGYMYLWQFAIGDDDGTLVIVFGRTIEQLIVFLSLLAKQLGLGARKKLLVYDFNLGFEQWFIDKYFEQTDYDLCGKSRHSILKYAPITGLEFREAQKVFSSKNLADLAKTYTTTQKIDEDDSFYNELRNQETRLTKEEYQYAFNDVKILAEFARLLYRTYTLNGFAIPQTAASMVRGAMKKACDDACKQGFHPSFIPQAATLEEYDLIVNKLNHGGVCISNPLYTGMQVDDALAYDRRSSYPYVLVRNVFPCGGFIKDEGDYKVEDFEAYLEENCNNPYGTCWYGLVKFKNLRRKKGIPYAPMLMKWCEEFDSVRRFNKARKGKNLSDISVSELEKLGFVFEYSDSHLMGHKGICSFWLTDVDYQTMKLMYDWDGEAVVFKPRFAPYYPLPEWLRKLIIKLYKYKESLRDNPSAYKAAKEFVNSVFGAMQMRLYLESTRVKKGTQVTRQKDYSKTIENERYFLSPYWGSWCTAYERYDLCDMLMSIDEKANEKYGVTATLYSDTDSVYSRFYDLALSVIEEKNAEIIEDWKEILDPEDFEECKLLGTWQPCYETDRGVSFKSLGSKRYCVRYTDKDGNTVEKSCVSGLAKDAIVKAAKEASQDLFKFFDERNKMNLTDKTVQYNSEPHSDYVTDRDGVTCEMKSLQSAVIVIEHFRTTLADYDMAVESAYGNMERGSGE